MEHVSPFVHTIFYSTRPKTYVATIMTIHSMSYFSASILETSIEGEVKWLPEMVRHILPTVLFSSRERKTQIWTIWNKVNAWKIKKSSLTPAVKKLHLLHFTLCTNMWYKIFGTQNRIHWGVHAWPTSKIKQQISTNKCRDKQLLITYF